MWLMCVYHTLRICGWCGEIRCVGSYSLTPLISINLSALEAHYIYALHLVKVALHELIKDGARKIRLVGSHLAPTSSNEAFIPFKVAYPTQSEDG